MRRSLLLTAETQSGAEDYGATVTAAHRRDAEWRRGLQRQIRGTAGTGMMRALEGLSLLLSMIEPSGRSRHELSGAVIAAALKVHSVLGPGLLESAYQPCLAHEIATRGLRVATQVPLPVEYDSIRLDVGYRVDIIVEGLLMVEVKAVSKLLPIHEAQLLSYLRLSGCRIGLLLNFHSAMLRDGIKRMVNGLPEQR